MFKDSHYAAVLGRALISIPFFLSGIGKIAAPAVTQGYIAAAGLPLPWVGYAIAVAVGKEFPHPQSVAPTCLELRPEWRRPESLVFRWVRFHPTTPPRP